MNVSCDLSAAPLPPGSPYCVVRTPDGYHLCNMSGVRVTEIHTTRGGALGEKRVGGARKLTENEQKRKTLQSKPRFKPSIHCKCCGGILGLGERWQHRDRRICERTKSQTTAPISTISRAAKFLVGALRSNNA